MLTDQTERTAVTDTAATCRGVNKFFYGFSLLAPNFAAIPSVVLHLGVVKFPTFPTLSALAYTTLQITPIIATTIFIMFHYLTTVAVNTAAFLLSTRACI